MKNFIFTLHQRSRVKVFWTLTVSTLLLVALLAVCLSCGKSNPVTPPGDEISLAKLQKTRRVFLLVTGGTNMLDNNGSITTGDGFEFDLVSFSLVWSGTSFSGTNTVMTADDTTFATATGTVSSDAKTVVSIEVVLHRNRWASSELTNLHAIVSNVPYSAASTASDTVYDYIMTGDLVESHTNILYYVFWKYSNFITGVGPYGVYGGDPKNHLKYLPGAWQTGTKKIQVEFQN